MLFRLVNAEYDHDTERTYVELRADDGDGGEIIATDLHFSFKGETDQTSNQTGDRPKGATCAKTCSGGYVRSEAYRDFRR